MKRYSACLGRPERTTTLDEVGSCSWRRFCLIPVFVLEFDATGGWKQAAFVTDWVIWGVLAVEFAAVMTVAERKAAALRAHWVDVAVVVLTIPLFSQLLASLRFARFARLLRLLGATAVITRALQAERRLTSAQAFRTVACSRSSSSSSPASPKPKCIQATSRGIGSDEVLETLQRIEADSDDLKARLPAS